MTDSPAYQVLARKYRPETFADLVGQDAMVRTLKNAFEADRIAQAFIMTGINGTGKTTTARIIAKGWCIGLDGQGGPTTEPCGQCEHCTAIMEGRHVDVLKWTRQPHGCERHPRNHRFRPLPGRIRALQNLYHRRSAHAVDR